MKLLETILEYLNRPYLNNLTWRLEKVKSGWNLKFGICRIFLSKASYFVKNLVTLKLVNQLVLQPFFELVNLHRK